MMWSFRRLISVGFQLLWYNVNLAFAYYTGAPSSQCSSMTPGHGYASQSLPGPYRIVISKETYIPYELVDVTIQAPGSQPFAGFLLQAVKADDINTNIGTFQQVNNIAKYVCGQAGLTHMSQTLKDSQTFQWRAPLTGLAAVVFRLTVVRNYKIYYVDIRSDILRQAVKDATTSSSLVPSSSVIIFSSSTTQKVATTELNNILSTIIPRSTQTISSSLISSSTSSLLTSSSHVLSKISDAVSLTPFTTSLSEGASSAAKIQRTQISFSPTPTQTISMSSTPPGDDTNRNLRDTEDGDDSSNKDLRVALMIASIAAWVLVVLVAAFFKFRRS